MEEIVPLRSTEDTAGDDQRSFAPDVEPAYSDPAQFKGRYEVDPIPGGKRFQGAWLVLDDGTRYVIAYRPVSKHFKFLDKRVVIRGCLYTPGRDTQHILADHLEVHSIELAPGESPYLLPPTEPIAPPIARTAAELAARGDRWVQVVGTLESVRNDPDGFLGIAWLRLVDGTAICARNVRMEEWSRHLGEVMTVTSRVTRLDDGGVVSFELGGWYAICEPASAHCTAAHPTRSEP